MMETICIIPVYNENSVRLQNLINESIKHVDQVLIMDDGSDKNVQLKNCIIMKNKQNIGKGYSLRKGFGYAIKNKYDNVIMMDGDGEHDPKDISKFLKELKKGNGLVIGTRKQHRSFSRTVLNKWMNFWVNILVTLKDSSCGYRAIDIKSLKKLSLKSNSFEIDLELILECHQNRIKISNVPIVSKTIDKSKVSFKDYLVINNFFDSWILKNMKYLDLNHVRKLLLKVSAHIGVFIGNLFLIFI